MSKKGVVAKIKVPFDISYRNDIEDGSVSVVTEGGDAVKIVAWDYPDPYPIAALIVPEGETYPEAFHYTIGGKIAGIKRPSWLNLCIIIPDDDSGWEPNILEVMKANEDLHKMAKRWSDRFTKKEDGWHPEEVAWGFVAGYKSKTKELSGWTDDDETMLRTIISDGSRGVELDKKQIAWLRHISTRVTKIED